MTVNSHRTLDLTIHATSRIHARRLGEDAVEAAILYGRVVQTRGADIYAIGRREVERARRQDIDLARFEGVQVVCDHGAILTAYRNRDFRGLRTGGRPCRLKRAVTSTAA